MIFKKVMVFKTVLNLWSLNFTLKEDAKYDTVSCLVFHGL